MTKIVLSTGKIDIVIKRYIDVNLLLPLEDRRNVKNVLMNVSIISITMGMVFLIIVIATV